MTIFRSRAATSLAVLAALSLTATPALARPDRGPRHWHGHHRGNGISGGDVLAGLLVVGGAAAIATAVSNSNNKSETTTQASVDGPAPYSYPDDGADSEPADQGGAAYPGGPVGDEARDAEHDGGDDRDQASNSGSLGQAVDACEAELERGDKRVEAIDSARRIGERYAVEGKLEGGSAFACSVDDTGHIRSVAVDGRAMV
jgi:hypothetical protein